MTVATKLRAAFGLYIAILAALLVYHVRTIQHAVGSGQELTAISSRLRVTSTEQLARIGQMGNDAEKYLVTRDGGYLDKFLETAHAYGLELQRLHTLPLSAAERTWLGPLDAHWADVAAEAQQLADHRSAPPETARASVVRLQQSLENVQVETQQLAAAAQDAMTRELQESERSARQAERLSWIAAVGALLLSVLLSALLVRSIVLPLERLTEGTREVSAGRFDYRLVARGRDEFAQVAHDFNSMTERLDELDRMKRDFVSKVSHDLKTPLSSMQETISVLLDELAGPLTAKQRQLLELNRDGGRRLAAMLSKLLDLSRIEAGLEPDFQMVDVVQLVRQSVERMDGARRERGLQTSITEPVRRLLVRGDAAGLTQVFDNLLENAIKFSPNGAELSVAIVDLPSRGDRVPPERWTALQRRGLGGEAVLITVADVGPGIPDSEKERVFARFYQAEAGRAIPARGVGLGLTIVQEIVTAHGGVIWVSDNDPQGSIFNVLLPGAVSMADESQTAAMVATNEAHT
jgi:two-component system sensor histidine kinase GlrK